MIDSALYRKAHDMQKREDFAGWCKFFIILLSVLLLFTIFIRSAFSGIYVIGNSMSPTLSDGDFLIANLLKEPRRDAIVVIKIPERFSQEFTGEYIIKRVIATEGQTVDIDYETGVVYVDGEAVDETQFGLENGITTRPYSTLEAMVFPQTVPEGCVWVMGDNRENSADSRYFGPVSREDLIAVAVFRYWPLTRIGPM